MSALDRLRARLHTVREHADDPAIAPDLLRADAAERERRAVPPTLHQFLPPRRYRLFADGRELGSALAATPTHAILALAAERRAAGDCDGTRLEVQDDGEGNAYDSETLGFFARYFPAAVDGAGAASARTEYERIAARKRALLRSGRLR